VQRIRRSLFDRTAWVPVTPLAAVMVLALVVGLTRLAFTLFIRGTRLRVEITRTEAKYAVADGKPLEIMHCGEGVSLVAGKPQTRRIKAIQPRPRPSQPPGRAPARRRAGEIPIAAVTERTERATARAERTRG